MYIDPFSDFLHMSSLIFLLFWVSFLTPDVSFVDSKAWVLTLIQYMEYHNLWNVTCAHMRQWQGKAKIKDRANRQILNKESTIVNGSPHKEFGQIL